MKLGESMGVVGLRDHPPRFVEACVEQHARERIRMPAPGRRDAVIERDGVWRSAMPRSTAHWYGVGKESA
ncbi:hypothetical protein A5785_14505 [Gordonia sp. 852002-50395_SCH5434458]|nr:hypothetical protein A5777_14405 [Gordonia sp. 852002-10350_SCH5691597]OBC04315.1 hypothetical protein A5785_14505 [Gordonia sp. 852002-50395_SCH5434458]